MFGIGIGELILILVIALIVFGPEKLPEIARNIGKFYRQIRDFSDNVRENIERELNIDVLSDVNKIPKDMKSLVLPPEEVEKRKRELMKRLEKKKKAEEQNAEVEENGKEENGDKEQ